ncbi:MAG: hypothetical protein AAGI68_15550 [Planctomycetota bacterium]
MPTRRLITVVIACLILSAGLCFLAGCGTTSADRLTMARGFAEQAGERVESIDASIAEGEKHVERLTDLLSMVVGDERAEEIGAQIEEAQAILEGLREQKDEAVASAERWADEVKAIEARGDVGWADEAQAAAEGGKEVGGFLPEPFGSITVAVSGALSIVFGLIAERNRRQKRRVALSWSEQEAKAHELEEYLKSREAYIAVVNADADRTKEALKEVVSGVENVISRTAPDSVDLFKQTLKFHQSPATEEAVRALKKAA